MRKIVFHGSCADGIAAREILRLIYPQAKCVPYYFQKPDKIEDSELWVDCSPPSFEDKNIILDKGGLILEHHVSSFVDLLILKRTYPDQIFLGDNAAENPESGAVLAHRLFVDYLNNHHSEFTIEFLNDLEEYARTVAAGDTFRKDKSEFELARSLQKVVMFQGNAFKFEDWKSLKALSLKMMPVFKMQAKTKANRAIIRPNPFTTIAFMNDIGISDAADILLGKVDMVVGYNVGLDEKTNEARLFFSIRCNDNIAERLLSLAKQNGGGGHLNAHGFSMKDDFLMHPIDTYESEFTLLV